MLRGRKPEQGNGSVKGQAGLSAQRSRFSWVHGCIWSSRFVTSSDRVRGRSPSHHHAHRTHHANDAASRYREVWHRAASGPAKRASGTATGTTHGTRRAASGAAHRTPRATGRARRHHHRHRDRAEKVICPQAPTTAAARLTAGRRKPYRSPPAPGQGHRADRASALKRQGCATRTPSRGLSAALRQVHGDDIARVMLNDGLSLAALIDAVLRSPLKNHDAIKLITRALSSGDFFVTPDFGSVSHLKYFCDRPKSLHVVDIAILALDHGTIASTDIRLRLMPSGSQAVHRSGWRKVARFLVRLRRS